MKRSALNTLDHLSADSFLYLTDSTDEHPPGTGNGLDDAGAHADDGRDQGLVTAGIAPGDLPQGSSPQAPPPGSGFQLAPDPGFAAQVPWFDGDLGLDLLGAKGGSPKGAGKGSEKVGGGSAGAVTDYHSGSWDGSDGYDIWLEFKGSGWTADLQKAFMQAADYFTGGTSKTHASNPGVITADIGGGARVDGKFVDDLYVTAELADIDGVGQVLGRAGPSWLWGQSYLTATGSMQFDVADAQDFFGRGLWDDIVTHELMHVLGFGTLWDFGPHDLLDASGEYVGQGGSPGEALAAYQESQQGAQFIPVEHDGGPGTAGGHWDEAALTNELMTGYIQDDRNPKTVGDNYLSKFSVMSLADLGYAVAYDDYQYDGYTAPEALIA